MKLIGFNCTSVVTCLVLVMLMTGGDMVKSCDLSSECDNSKFCDSGECKNRKARGDDCKFNPQCSGTLSCVKTTAGKKCFKDEADAAAASEERGNGLPPILTRLLNALTTVKRRYGGYYY